MHLGQKHILHKTLHILWKLSDVSETFLCVCMNWGSLFFIISSPCIFCCLMLFDKTFTTCLKQYKHVWNMKYSQSFIATWNDRFLLKTEITFFYLWWLKLKSHHISQMDEIFHPPFPLGSLASVKNIIKAKKIFNAVIHNYWLYWQGA